MIFLILIAIFMITSPQMTGKVVLNNNHAYTKAICSENNYCEDYLITCSGKKLESMSPTGFAIQKNPSEKINTSIENYCE